MGERIFIMTIHKCEVCGNNTFNGEVVCSTLCAIVSVQPGNCPLCGGITIHDGILCRGCHKEVAGVKIPWSSMGKSLDDGWKEWHLAT